MWVRTHSVMFASDAAELIDEKPYLPDLQFNARRFKGLGFKIGDRCFFGIPAGVPADVDSDASDPTGAGLPKTGSSLIHCEF